MKDYQEPEVVAWLYTLVGRSGEIADREVSVINWDESYRPFGRPGIDFHEEGAVRKQPLITLQSHRDAVAGLHRALDFSDEVDANVDAYVRETIAKKDAALQACIDALGACRTMAKDSDGNYTREVTPKVIVDALAKANEALK